MKRLTKLTLAAGLLICAHSAYCADPNQPSKRDMRRDYHRIVGRSARVELLAGDLQFTEGPAADKSGDIYFSDVPASKIYKWSINSRKLSVYIEDSRGANGLYFNPDGELVACESQYGGRQVVIIGGDKRSRVLADRFEGKRFNSPNDLWVDPNGGVYFTDPRYGDKKDLELDVEAVYYIAGEKQKPIRVIDDMIRPNGIIGTPDAKKLYVTDQGDNKTYVYDINSTGQLEGKKLFCTQGSDGMTLDEAGNLYLTGDGVSIYNSQGRLLGKIEVPERCTNVCFGRRGGRTLYITAGKSLYSAKLRIRGAAVKNIFQDRRKR